jgi:beta-lactamase regulating signal transducer with metallopeptidase domain
MQREHVVPNQGLERGNFSQIQHILHTLFKKTKITQNTMNPELLTLGLPICKYVIASALMVVFYWFLFREKTSFNNCRVYLLSIALVGLLISQFNILVYTPPAQIVEIEAQPVVLSASPRTIVPTASTPASVTPIKVTQNSSYAELLTVPNIALGIYIAVTCVLFISLFIQLFRILALKRSGEITLKDGFELVENDEIPTPFSFYKTIFLSPNLTGSKLDMILKHEQWHIKHRHYIDVFMMEVLVRLLWFNPVLWWVRNELRNVSEFHADRSVLDEGQELYSYQSIILEEVMENNPYLANGFNNSFTKKRFIMMKNKFNLRYATLRRALILPFFIGVFSLLCFTTGKSEVRYVEKKTDLQEPQNSASAIESLLPEKTSSGNTLKDSIKVNSGNNTYTFGMDKSTSDADIRKGMADFSAGLGNAIKKLNKIHENFSSTTLKKDLASVLTSLDVKTNQQNIAGFELSDTFISSITRQDIKNSIDNFTKIKTEIDVLRNEKPSMEQTQKFAGLAGSLISDNLILKIMSDVFQKSMAGLSAMPGMAGFQGKQFSDLFSNMATFRSKPFTTTTTTRVISSSPGLSNQNVAIVIDSAMMPSINEINNQQKERQAQDAKIRNEAYRAKSEQIKLSDLPYDSRETKVVRIEKNEKDTKVTLAIPIRKNESWVYFDSGFSIVNKLNQDRYVIRKLENNFPLDKTIIISNYNQKMIEVTLIFPPLPETVELVDIIEFQSNKGLKMSDGSGGWKFLGLVISHYSGKIFR